MLTHQIQGDGVLVDIVSAGICGSDHIYYIRSTFPHVAGHEIAGITPNGACCQ